MSFNLFIPRQQRHLLNKHPRTRSFLSKARSGQGNMNEEREMNTGVLSVAMEPQEVIPSSWFCVRNFPGPKAVRISSPDAHPCPALSHYGALLVGAVSVGGSLENYGHLGVYNNIVVEKDLSESILALNIA